MKKQPVPKEKTKIRAELMFIVEVSVDDPDDISEICREVVDKFRGQVRRHEVSITDSIVKTEII